MSDNLEYSTVTLSLDGDIECECAIIRIFPAGDNTYIALLPIEDEENDEVYLYRFTQQDNEEPLLENIETDEEYEIVSKAFEEELEAMEMEAIYDESDL
jgi:uncharacterized protein YrzB (UPF0473 family)